jgi:hypothetical protein
VLPVALLFVPPALGAGSVEPLPVVLGVAVLGVALAVPAARRPRR